MLLLVAALLPLVVCRPGSPWTEEEALIVKAKLYAIIGEYGSRVSSEYLALHPELGFDTWPEPKSLPNAAKFLRLGFHGCLQYVGHTGGCNGCLNIDGIGLENRHTCIAHSNQ